MSKKCPFFKKPCLEDGCMFWVHVLGQKPDSQDSVDLYDCTFRWLPTLQIETSKQARNTAAAVEDERNLIHRGLTNQLTRSDMAIQYDDIAEDGIPRLNGEVLDG
jgi:hypothetical protein